MKLVSLNCPNCSSALQIALDTETVTCQYCQSLVTISREVQLGEFRKLLSTADGIEKVTRNTAREVADIKKSLEYLQGRQESDESANQMDPDAPTTSTEDSGFSFAVVFFVGVILIFSVYIMYLAGFWWGVFTGSFLGFGLLNMTSPLLTVLPPSLWDTTDRVMVWALTLGVIVPLLVKCAF